MVVFPENVPVVYVMETNVIITSPWIEDGLVREAFVEFSFTIIIFHVPSIEAGTVSFLHAKSISPVNEIRRMQSFIFHDFIL